jgi:hypothetical protein
LGFTPIGIAVILVVLVFPAETCAQYLYLDSNGNGVHDSGDRMRVCPTEVDVWLNTAMNRDGSPATCPFGTGALSLSHYEFELQAVGGTVTWGPMTNHMAGFGLHLGYVTGDSIDPVFYHNGWAATSVADLPVPGLYRLASLTISSATGSPRIDIITRHPVRGRERTSFGCECPVDAEYDHMNRKGSGWNDVDGLAAPLSTDAPPVTVAPGIAVPQDGALVTFEVSATDPDVDPIIGLTADLSGLPPGNDASFIVAGPHTPKATGTFSWTPTSADSGDYNVGFVASNCVSSPTRTTVIHVIGIPTGVEDDQSPLTNSVSANRPNPFQLSTSLEYTLSHESAVHISIYSVSGRRVRSLFQGRVPAGPHRIVWDGRDESGNPMPSGVYWCHLDAGSLRASRRMALVR